jgi:hypothetical protein
LAADLLSRGIGDPRAHSDQVMTEAEMCVNCLAVDYIDLIERARSRGESDCALQDLTTQCAAKLRSYLQQDHSPAEVADMVVGFFEVVDVEPPMMH